jgi:hypothetical protein
VNHDPAKTNMCRVIGTRQDRATSAHTASQRCEAPPPTHRAPTDRHDTSDRKPTNVNESERWPDEKDLTNSVDHAGLAGPSRDGSGGHLPVHTSIETLHRRHGRNMDALVTTGVWVADTEHWAFGGGGRERPSGREPPPAKLRVTSSINQDGLGRVRAAQVG